MTPDTQKQALRRIKIIAGQVGALEKQIEEDRYCMDVLDLSLSIQKALRSLDGLVIEGHLRTHVVEQMTGGEMDTRGERTASPLQGPGAGRSPNVRDPVRKERTMAQTITLNISGMTCDHCVHAVTKAAQGGSRRHGREGHPRRRSRRS